MRPRLPRLRPCRRYDVDTNRCQKCHERLTVAPPDQCAWLGHHVVHRGIACFRRLYPTQSRTPHAVGCSEHNHNRKFRFWYRRSSVSYYRLSWSICNGPHQSDFTYPGAHFLLWSSLPRKQWQLDEFPEYVYVSDYKHSGTSRCC